MGISGAFVGAQYAGNQMNHVALSPRYAGTMYGMTNGVANLCGFLAPYTIGSIIDKNVSWAVLVYVVQILNILYVCAT